MKQLYSINDERYYLWLAINSETRFILVFYLTKSRNSDSSYTLINEAKTCGEPTYFITDRLSSYNEAASTVLSNTEHVPVAPMSSDINNNLIESFNNCTPAEVVGFASDSFAKNSWLSAA